MSHICLSPEGEVTVVVAHLDDGATHSVREHPLDDAVTPHLEDLFVDPEFIFDEIDSNLSGRDGYSGQLRLTDSDLDLCARVVAVDHDLDRTVEAVDANFDLAVVGLGPDFHIEQAVVELRADGALVVDDEHVAVVNLNLNAATAIIVVDVDVAVVDLDLNWPAIIVDVRLTIVVLDLNLPCVLPYCEDFMWHDSLFRKHFVWKCSSESIA